MQAKQDGREKTGWRPPAQLVDHAPDCARKRPKVPSWKAVAAATDIDQRDRKHKHLLTTIYVTGTRTCWWTLTCKRYDAAQKSITDNRTPPRRSSHSGTKRLLSQRWFATWRGERRNMKVQLLTFAQIKRVDFCSAFLFCSKSTVLEMKSLETSHRWRKQVIS